MRLNNSSSEKKISKSPKEKLKELHSSEMVKFLFYDETSLDFDKNLIISISPTILENVPKCKEYYIIRAPYGISKDDFSTFLYIYSNITFHTGQQIGSNTKKLLSILKLMDFFNNEKFNIQIITNIIIPELNSNIAIDLIIFSYDKLCYFSENGQEADNAYFELFYQALEELSKNEMLIIKSIDKLKSLDGKIIEELIQKTFRNLIFGKYLIENDDSSNNSKNEHIHSDINQMNYFEENEVGSRDINKKKKIEEAKNNNKENTKIINIKNLKNLIEFLMKINNLDNIFSLLTKEYMSLFSSESINELQNMPNPSFQVKIPMAIYENYYEEFPLDININNQLLYLVIFYKIGDKSINACIKLSSKKMEKNNIGKNENEKKNKNTFDILTFLTNVSVEKNKKILTIQNNLTSLTNNKSMYSILKIPHFNLEVNNGISKTNTNSNLYNNDNDNISTKIGNNDEGFFYITVQIKLCYIYSILSSYLLQDFYNYVNDRNISKLSKQLFILLIKNNKLNKKNENNLLKSILLWLDDEINIKEDISEIFYLIRWEEIDDDLIFELLIKYSHIILNDESLENFFLDIYLHKFGQSKIVESTILKLFKAIKKIEYHKMYSLLKKSEKIIESFQTQKYKNENNLKELLLNNKKNKIPPQTININASTQTNEQYNRKKGEGGGAFKNFDEKKKLIKKQDCFWNVSRIKNYIKDKNTPSTTNSNSLNDIITKHKPSQRKSEGDKKDKKEKKDIPKPKSKSANISTKINNYKNKSIDKNTNKKKNNEIIDTNKSINYNAKEGNKEKDKIKRSKSNKVVKKEKRENLNISFMKKSESKIKEMLIFPYNFSSIKKFQQNINFNNINSTNIKLNKNIFDRNKSNRCMNNNISLSNRQLSFENKYNTGRNKNKENNNNNISSRPYSENRIKINFGIIKEICFMNNNFYN